MDGDATLRLERELAHVRGQLADSERRYEGLRRRKSVRAALKIASLRPGARARASGGVAAAPPASSSATPGPTPEEVTPAPVVKGWPPGHFYSPVPDIAELGSEEVSNRVWPAEPRDPVGINWRSADQLQLLSELASQPPMVVPRTSEDPQEYRLENEMFNGADAWFLQAMLRWLKPRRVIEVGCGFSSLLTARVNREYLERRTDVTCIEPYPPDFMVNGVHGITRLIQSRAELVPRELYAELEAGDVLFIDTSHTVKTGNDVRFLLQEVVPQLAPGVIIHIHDIFLPFDYPREWVLDGRAWNEQYLVEAFLSFNNAFEVLLAASWLRHHHYAAVASAAPVLAELGGVSLWLRRSQDT